MAHILITGGPTRAYLDEVRYLTNASSGRMAAALAEAALAAGHRVSVVSGPVEVAYPAAARVVEVMTTDEMLAACLRLLPRVDGVIAAAAPCDFRPRRRRKGKIQRQSSGLSLALVPSTDVIATLATRARRGKRRRWFVAFALEADADRERAIAKLRRKRCDLIVVNDLSAIDSDSTAVTVLDEAGEVATTRGSKAAVARRLVRIIDRRLGGAEGRVGLVW